MLDTADIMPDDIYFGVYYVDNFFIDMYGTKSNDVVNDNHNKEVGYPYYSYHYQMNI